MFRFFENLVDPYVEYTQQDAPPKKLWPFFRVYSEPFKKVFILTGVMSVAVAAIEIGLIYYMGRLVDLLSGSPAEVWRLYGVEFIVVALAILFLRPMVLALDVLLLNNAVLPNYGALFRWRTHRQVLRQSVGWFEDDFAGRIANRIMQTPPAAGQVVFQVFDAISYSLAYLLGAAILLATSDWKLMVPLLLWFALYAALTRWTVLKVAVASKASSDARSLVTGRVVDTYTNIHSVKMFAHHDREIWVPNRRHRRVGVLPVVYRAGYRWCRYGCDGAGSAAKFNDGVDHVGAVDLLSTAWCGCRRARNHRPTGSSRRSA